MVRQDDTWSRDPLALTGPNPAKKHSRARTGSLVMESQQVKRARPSDGSTGHRPYYTAAVCWRGTVLGIRGGASLSSCWDPLQRQTDGQMEELRGPVLLCTATL
ncbi:hypothetical protein Baya_9127 [Bagarius yarrelli]|uniref:Uncharacterized protein n=1 Tax=Bagarius yarrelli TaxID=175774 RepID=A0A556U882_BAGYA|nr:hypothetical protein Baya_9127 [Bagarius yarrelli]